MIVEIPQGLTQIIPFRYNSTYLVYCCFKYTVECSNAGSVAAGCKLIATDLCDATVTNISKVIELCI
jgi:hypothetical protein